MQSSTLMSVPGTRIRFSEQHKEMPTPYHTLRHENAATIGLCPTA